MLLGGLAATFILLFNPAMLAACAPNGIEEVLVYQEFENMTMSFYWDSKGGAEYTVWGNGRVRRRHRGQVDDTVVNQFIQMVTNLPPHPRAPRRNGLSNATEAVFEPDFFYSF